MKAFTISFALITAALVTGCSGQSTASTTSTSQQPQPQVIYQGDHPEAAKLKAHAVCMAAAIEHGSYSDQLACHHRFQ